MILSKNTDPSQTPSVAAGSVLIFPDLDGVWRVKNAAGVTSILGEPQPPVVIDKDDADEPLSYTANSSPEFTHSLGRRPTIRVVEAKIGEYWRTVDIKCVYSDTDNPTSKIKLLPVGTSYELIKITLL